MGRGQILSHIKDGEYVLKLDVGKAQRDQRVAALDAELADLDAFLAEMRVERDEARTEMNEAQAKVDELVTEMEELPEQVEQAFDALVDAEEDYRDALEGGYEPAIEAAGAALAAANGAYGEKVAAYESVGARTSEAVKKLIEAQGEFYGLDKEVKTLEAKRLGITKEKTRLAGIAIEREVNAWCADASLEVTGTVATIEVPGEPAEVLIAPGGRAPTDADGSLMARDLMSPAQLFWNVAVLPGWQKWKPDYRKGTITGLNFEAKTATVSLDAATSSADAMGINQSETLTNVPVKYMTCDTDAFGIDDRVIVQFEERDWSRPKVIGFVEKPSMCDRWPCVAGTDISYIFSTGSSSGLWQKAMFNLTTLRVFIKIGGGIWTELPERTGIRIAGVRRGWDPGAPSGLQVDPYVFVRNQTFVGFGQPNPTQVNWIVEVQWKGVSDGPGTGETNHVVIYDGDVRIFNSAMKGYESGQESTGRIDLVTYSNPVAPLEGYDLRLGPYPL